MKGQNLLKEFLKEKDKNKKRIFKYSTVFRFGTDNIKVIEETMEWAYKKGCGGVKNE